MKPGIEAGVGVVELEVTPDMTAVLDGRAIHAVYSTFWLSYHFEVAARRAIEPFFEEADNAVGVSVSVNHVAMAAVGAKVRIVATVREVRGRYIGCSLTAHVLPSNTLIARGEQGQVLLASNTLQDKVANAVTQ